MRQRGHILSALLLAALLAAGCANAAPASSHPAGGNPAAPAASSGAASPAPQPGAALWLHNRYVQQLVEDTLAQLPLAGLEDWQKVQRVYEQLVAGVTFADPVGLDCWQYRGQPGDVQPPYLEQRALSPLAFGAGSCEDYAAAMTLLLQGLGLEARYLPGLTVSVEHTYVDHAWTMVRLEGQWYHLDPQLERNVLKDNRLTYRYFLRGDQEMLADHLWGEHWIAYGKAGAKPLTAAQLAEIQSQYTPQPCPQSYPTPAPRTLTLSPPPDITAILARLDSEKRQYQQQYGPLPTLQPDILPPVFGADATRASGAPMGLLSDQDAAPHTFPLP